MQETVWQCNLCPAALLFASKASFVSHFNRTCHICDVEFTSQGIAQLHRKALHMKPESRHVCNMCAEGFHDSSHFKEHTKQHKPYRCVACSQEFRGFQAFSQHIEEATCGWKDIASRLGEPVGNVCFACREANGCLEGLMQHFLACALAKRSDQSQLPPADEATVEYYIRKELKNKPESAECNNNTSRTPRATTAPIRVREIVCSSNGPSKTLSGTKIASVSPTPRIRCARKQTSYNYPKSSRSPLRDAVRDATRLSSLGRVFGASFIKLLDVLVAYASGPEHLQVTDMSQHLPLSFSLGEERLRLPLVALVENQNKNTRVVVTREARADHRLEKGTYFSFKHQGLVLKSSGRQYASAHDALRFANEAETPHFSISEDTRFPFIDELCVKRCSPPMHECGLCRAAFSSRAECERHAGLACHDCMAEFREPLQLYEHIIDVHVLGANDVGEEDTFYECPFCDKRTCHLVTLARHVRLFHPTTAAAQDGQPIVQCDSACRSLFHGLKSLEEHRRHGSCSGRRDERDSGGGGGGGLEDWLSSREPLSGAILTEVNFVCLFCPYVCQFLDAAPYDEHLRSAHGVTMTTTSEAGTRLITFTFYPQPPSPPLSCEDDDLDVLTPSTGFALVSRSQALLLARQEHESRVICQGIRKLAGRKYGVQVNVAGENGDEEPRIVPIKVSLDCLSEGLLCLHCNQTVDNVDHFRLRLLSSGICYDCRQNEENSAEEANSLEDVAVPVNNMLNNIPEHESLKRKIELSRFAAAGPEEPFEGPGRGVKLPRMLTRTDRQNPEENHKSSARSVSREAFIKIRTKNGIPPSSEKPVISVSIRKNLPLILTDEDNLGLPGGLQPEEIPVDDNYTGVNPVMKIPFNVNLNDLTDPLYYEKGPVLFGTTEDGKWVEEKKRNLDSPLLPAPDEQPCIEWDNSIESDDENDYDDSDDSDYVIAGFNVDGTMDMDGSEDEDGEQSALEPSAAAATANASSSIQEQTATTSSSNLSSGIQYTVVRMDESGQPRQATPEETQCLRGLLRHKSFHKLCSDKSATQCSECNEWFNNKENMIAHKVFEHLRHFCQYCGEMFNDGQEKSVHLMFKHDCHVCPNASRKCNAVLPTYYDLVMHNFHEHDIYYCPFCSYPLSSANIEMHLKRNHNVRCCHSANSLFEEILDKNFQIITDQMQRTVQCALCPIGKTFTRDKIYSHLRFRHHLLLEKAINFLSNCNFTTNQGVCENINDEEVLQMAEQARKDKIVGLSKDRIVFMEDMGEPDSPYACDLCENREFGDSGLHLILQHGYRSCYHCSVFFASPKDLETHLAKTCRQQPNNDCSRCQTPCRDLLDLLRHRSRKHNLYTCFLCPKTVYSEWATLKKHLIKSHRIQHPSLAGDQISSMRDLLMATLLKYIPSQDCFECRMCADSEALGSRRYMLDLGRHFARDQSLLILRHLRKIHAIRDNSLVLGMFDGEKISPLNLGAYVVDCMLCGASFKSSQDERRHLLKKHPTLQPQVTMIKMIPDLLTENIRVRSPPPSSSSAEAATGLSVDEVHEGDFFELYAAATTAETTAAVDHDDDRMLKAENNSEMADEEGVAEAAGPPLAVPNIKVEVKDVDDDDGRNGDNGNHEPDHDDAEQLWKAVTLAEVQQRGVKIEPETQLIEGDEILNFSEAPEPATASSLFECRLCSKVLASIAAFQSHMKGEHPHSDEEKNRPFPCDLCDKSFHFQSSLNSHRSKRHHKTSSSGSEFKCKLCPSVTNSKGGMRRHLKVCHKTDFFDEEYCYKCNYCPEMFWSVAERNQHMNAMHSDQAARQMARCQLCGHLSAHKDALRRHFARSHPNTPLTPDLCWHCPCCPQMDPSGSGGTFFQSKNELSRHVKECHSEASADAGMLSSLGLRAPKECPHCGKKFTKQSNLARHLHTNHGNFACNVCGREFETRRAMTFHKKASKRCQDPTSAGAALLAADQAGGEPKPAKARGFARERGYQCKLCEARFESFADRHIHYKKDHPDKFPFNCDDCDRGFHTRRLLTSHRSRKHGPTGADRESNMVKCDTCGKMLQKDSYREHLLIHSGVRYKCTHCPKQFVQRSNLRRHIRIHLGIKPFKCTFCPKTFTDSGACNAHQATHDDSRKVSCRYCGQTFAREQKLRYHMRIHTGVGLLHCQFCDKVFTNPYSLKCHLKSMHGSKWIICRCSFCDWEVEGSVSTAESQIGAHLKENHADVGSTCSECGVIQRSVLDLNRHIQNLHRGASGSTNNALYNCGHCDKGFFSRTDVNQHLANDHDIHAELSLHFTEGTKSHIPELDATRVGDDGDGASISQPCWHCEVGFQSTNSLRAHLSRVTGLGKVCPICSSTFPTVVRTNDHLLEEHADLDVEMTLKVLQDHHETKDQQKTEFEQDDVDFDDDFDDIPDPLGEGAEPEVLVSEAEEGDVDLGPQLSDDDGQIPDMDDDDELPLIGL